MESSGFFFSLWVKLSTIDRTGTIHMDVWISLRREGVTVPTMDLLSYERGMGNMGEQILSQRLGRF